MIVYLLQDGYMIRGVYPYVITSSIIPRNNKHQGFYLQFLSRIWVPLFPMDSEATPRAQLRPTALPIVERWIPQWQLEGGSISSWCPWSDGIIHWVDGNGNLWCNHWLWGFPGDFPHQPQIHRDTNFVWESVPLKHSWSDDQLHDKLSLLHQW